MISNKFTTTKTTTSTSSSSLIPTAVTTTTTKTATIAKLLHMLLALWQLLTLSVILVTLTALPQHATALPVTSQPLESTAEHLAWQAWLMLPPDQKNLEKSRKVTPKSIFTLPFRECPPGHHLYENRCIPTVNIDQTELLTQQLLGLVIGLPNEPSNYEFDYDEEDFDVYEPAQKLSGDTAYSGGGGNYDDASQLPSKDEPLKFNIFQHEFPTGDYDGEPSPSEEMVGFGMNFNGSNSMLSNDTRFMEAFNGYLERHANLTNSIASRSNATGSSTAPSTPIFTPNSAQQVDGAAGEVDATAVKENNTIADSKIETTNKSRLSIARDPSSVTASTMSLPSSPSPSPTPSLSSSASPLQSQAQSQSQPPSFAISEIDAISLPASPPLPSPRPSARPIVIGGGSSYTADAEFVRSNLEPLKVHRVSLFKDDSAVQLVTTVIATDRSNYDDALGTGAATDSTESASSPAVSVAVAAAQPDISQLLKADSLLPLFNATQLQQAATMINSNKIANSTVALENKSLGHSTDPSSESTAATAAQIEEEDGNGVAGAFNADDVTGMTITADDAEDDLDSEGTTITSSRFSDLLEAAASVRSSQLTVEKFERERSAEKVEVPGLDMGEFQSEGEEDEASTTTEMEPDDVTNIQLDDTTIIEKFDPLPEWSDELQRAPIETMKPNRVLEKSKVEPVPVSTPPAAAVTAAPAPVATTVPPTVAAIASTTTPLPSVADSPTPADGGNRFHYQHVSDEHFGAAAGKERSVGSADDDSGSAFNSITSSKSSEIDIEQELRIINELVKGRRRQQQQQQQEKRVEQHGIPINEKPINKVTSAITATTTTRTSTASTSTTTKSTLGSEQETGNPTTTESSRTSTTDRAINLITTKISTSTSASASASTSTSSATTPSSVDASSAESVVDSTSTRSLTPTKAEHRRVAAPSVETTTQMWSQIMPIVRSSGDETVTSSLKGKSTLAVEQSTATPTITQSEEEASNSSGDTPRSKLSINSNRSNRNSKIFRINSFSLSKNSLSEESAHASQHLATATAPAVTFDSDLPSTSIARAEAPTTTTPKPSADAGEPFWWLPTGWRLDRPASPPSDSRTRTNKNGNNSLVRKSSLTHRDIGGGDGPSNFGIAPLLLRFWSAFPGNDAKVN